MGMNFSLINSSMISQNPADSINLFWNERFADSQARQLMFMTPSFQGTICNLFPEYGMYGNSLLDPMLAIQQTMQQFQNGSWMQGGGWNFPFFGNQDYSSMWNNFWNRNNGNNGGSSSGELPDEYNSLKALLLKYKENDNGKHNFGKKIQDAINKSGNADEKMTALKNVYKEISIKDREGLKNALLSLDLYKKEIIASGYGLDKLDKEANTNLNKTIKTMYDNIKDEKFSELKIWLCGSEDGSVAAVGDDILTIISEWNDTYKNTGAKNERSIIYHLASKLPTNTDASDYNTRLDSHKEMVKELCRKLEERVIPLENEIDSDMYAKLQEKSTALSNAWDTAETTYNSTNLGNLAKAFEDLYVALRLAEASRISQNIQTKYAFVNDIASDDTDFVNKDLIIEETKTDLKAEGFKDETITAAVDDLGGENLGQVQTPASYHDNKTAQEQLELLIRENKIRETNTDGVYTNSSNAEHKHYMIKGDKLVELVGVTNIDSEGNCTVVGEKDKKPINDVETIEVNYSDVKSYSDTVAKVDSYINDEKIEKLNTFDGITVYKSTGTENGENNGKHQYFMIKDNKFQKINGTVDEQTGKVTLTTSSEEAKALKELESADLEIVSSASGIWDAASNDARKEQIEQEAEAAEEEKVKYLYGMGFEKVQKEGSITYKLMGHSCADFRYKSLIIGIDKNGKFVNKTGKTLTFSMNGEKVTIAADATITEEQICAYSGYILGEKVSRDLNWYTSPDELNEVFRIINRNLNSKNIRTFIQRFQQRETWGTDTLLEQIASEKGTLKERYTAIMKIIEVVMEYCKENNINQNNNDYYAMLVEKYCSKENDNYKINLSKIADITKDQTACLDNIADRNMDAIYDLDTLILNILKISKSDGQDK